MTGSCVPPVRTHGGPLAGQVSRPLTLSSGLFRICARKVSPGPACPWSQGPSSETGRLTGHTKQMGGRPHPLCPQRADLGGCPRKPGVGQVGTHQETPARWLFPGPLALHPTLSPDPPTPARQATGCLPRPREPPSDPEGPRVRGRPDARLTLPGTPTLTCTRCPCDSCSEGGLPPAAGPGATPCHASFSSASESDAHTSGSSSGLWPATCRSTKRRG